MNKETDTQKLWDQEYSKIIGLASSSSKRKMSSHVISFMEILKKRRILNGTILDIGCGLGRDSVSFARTGYSVCGFDLSGEAIRKAKDGCPSYLKDRISFDIMDGKEKWQYVDNFCVGAFDGTTFINFISRRNIEHYTSEVKRIVKKNGYFMFVTPVLPDEYYSSLVRMQSSRIIQNHGGIRQMVYEKKDLLAHFEKTFNIKKVEEFTKSNEMFGEIYKRNQLRVLCKNENK